MDMHLPILLIVVPLVSAPLCVLLRQKTLVWAFASLVCVASLGMASMLLIRVLEEGVISYAIGGWIAPWGIEYRVDTINAFVLLLVSIIAAVLMFFALPSVADEISGKQHYLFYTAYLLCFTGLMGIAITGDAFNVFVFLEISSLSSYTLIALGRDRRALTASYQYLIMGTLGATFIVIGIGLMYMMTGTLNMFDLSERLPAMFETRTAMVAFAFLTVGMLIKLAMFPMHMWLPNAYCYAPSLVTAFLAATATKVSIYVFLRFTFTVWGTEFVFEKLNLDAFLIPLSLIGIYVASLSAIYQTNVKRLLAYSSVAQIGYMMLGIGFVSVTGLTGGIVHLFNHALMKAALFLSVGSAVLRLGSSDLADWKGLGRRMPVTMAAFVLAGLSLIGVPLTVGFISKWYLILAALEAGWWPIALLALLSSLLAVIYVWRVVEVAYFQKADDDSNVQEAPLMMQISMWILTGATLYFGIQTDLTVSVAQRAAGLLLGVTP
ncbi:MAG: monovalent cation/H+ antiporter subunit D family protein [Candidatus Latescibacteria bacterium]|nr:monovalent cation/H+ antiporter subunit D family protein [Candidatus Latescibacterota bacterium]